MESFWNWIRSNWRRRLRWRGFGAPSGDSSAVILDATSAIRLEVNEIETTSERILRVCLLNTYLI